MPNSFFLSSKLSLYLMFWNSRLDRDQHSHTHCKRKSMTSMICLFYNLSCLMRKSFLLRKNRSYSVYFVPEKLFLTVLYLCLWADCVAAGFWALWPCSSLMSRVLKVLKFSSSLQASLMDTHRIAMACILYIQYCTLKGNERFLLLSTFCQPGTLVYRC